ncbi:VOC family protein [Rhizobium sp. 0TCS1.26]|uniref:VOC family protein n=1 Tax=Rhizobium sp. 0TCS1.26 TaxID=3142623 RepID=UPI003D2B3260
MVDHDLIAFGSIHLEVRNVETTARFWESLFGFTRRTFGDSIELGTEKETLIVLHGGATEPVRQGHSGLYHLAIHTPDQRDFARLLKRFSDLRYPCSPTDHTFSRAIYLDDPDGINIEVTLETPERFRAFRPVGSRLAFIGTDGTERPGSYPLDLQEIHQSYEPGSELEAAHPATKVGHIHLYVADLERSRDFYTGLGFELARWWPPMQVADFGAGGAFKHRIAINTWQGIGAPVHPQGMARMRHFELRFETMERLNAAVNANPSARSLGAAHVLQDPSGIELRLVRA